MSRIPVHPRVPTLIDVPRPRLEVILELTVVGAGLPKVHEVKSDDSQVMLDEQEKERRIRAGKSLRAWAEEKGLLPDSRGPTTGRGPDDESGEGRLAALGNARAGWRTIPYTWERGVGQPRLSNIR